MYARYFNHKQTENALLDRGAEQDVEGLKRMKWPDIVREIQITNNSMIQSSLAKFMLLVSINT